ncbi:MAG: cyclic nucleotide-binding domain-containing protein [Bacteroidales bacterium]|nr:cyclic nucleotide-binding domain-containing protein [Bacteroidales bacterium]
MNNERYVRLPEVVIRELELRAETAAFRRNEYLLTAGQRCNKIWFLKKGLVRKFHLDEGREVTSWIHCEDDIFTSLESYARKSPSVEYLQACEDTEVIGISRENSQMLARRKGSLSIWTDR